MELELGVELGVELGDEPVVELVVEPVWELVRNVDLDVGDVERWWLERLKPEL